MDSRPRAATLTREGRRTSNATHASAILQFRPRLLRTTAAALEEATKRSCIADSGRDGTSSIRILDGYWPIVSRFLRKGGSPATTEATRLPRLSEGGSLKHGFERAWLPAAAQAHIPHETGPNLSAKRCPTAVAFPAQQLPANGSRQGREINRAAAECDLRASTPRQSD
jgi:hypothetical protein